MYSITTFQRFEASGLRLQADVCELDSPAVKVRLLAESNVRRCFWLPHIAMCLPMRSIANVRPL
eukprot:COSAG03_NODE_883_length_5497_cov_4.608744_5_plen_64_part_00